MPLVGISTRTLRRLVGRRLDTGELIAALEQLGCDVEGHATVTLYRCDRCGHITEVLEHEDFNRACPACTGPDLADAGGHEVIRISLLPVRPDMFDVAGLARALRGYLDIETGPAKLETTGSGYAVRVRPGLEEVRPHIAACVVRGLALDDETLRTVMKMQENLHWALGRDRRRASIGVYDLARVEPDFEYGPVDPGGISFVPLGGMPEGMVAATPGEILARHPKGAAYAHLLAGREAWPLLSDSRGRVLSLPPVINSEETRVLPGTRDLFVDVTGPDRHAVTRTLAVIAFALADLGARVETVRILGPGDRDGHETPDLAPTTVVVEPDAVERLLGAAVPDMAAVLERMRYGVRRDGARYEVTVPAYRSDIMHERDVLEDIAIGHGYRNIEPRLVASMTVGSHLPVEELSTTVRRVMTGLGFLETMTLALTSEGEGWELLDLETPERRVRLANPISVEQTTAREQLITGLLSTFRLNTTRRMPQNIFEAGDTYHLARECETGVRTTRRLAAGMTGPEAGFADARRTVETLARELGVEPVFAETEHPAFIPGRCARVAVKRPGPLPRADWGLIGEIHPRVLERFGISQPTAVLELSLSTLLKEE